MLFLVCFRCIQVFTGEENHSCLSSDDHVLTIDYNNFKRYFRTSRKKAREQRSGGKLNRSSINRSTRKNDEYSSRGTPYRSLSENNSFLHLEAFANAIGTTFNECQKNDKDIGALNSNAFLSNEKSFLNIPQDSVAMGYSNAFLSNEKSSLNIPQDSVAMGYSNAFLSNEKSSLNIPQDSFAMGNLPSASQIARAHYFPALNNSTNSNLTGNHLQNYYWYDDRPFESNYFSKQHMLFQEGQFIHLNIHP